MEDQFAPACLDIWVIQGWAVFQLRHVPKAPFAHHHLNVATEFVAQFVTRNVTALLTNCVLKEFVKLHAKPVCLIFLIYLIHTVCVLY